MAGAPPATSAGLPLAGRAEAFDALGLGLLPLGALGLRLAVTFWAAAASFLVVPLRGGLLRAGAGLAGASRAKRAAF